VEFRYNQIALQKTEPVVRFQAGPGHIYCHHQAKIPSFVAAVSAGCLGLS